MKPVIKLITSLFFTFTLAGCVQTTNDPAVGKADFLKFQTWIESEPLEDNPDFKEPETIDGIQKFMDESFKKYIQQGKNLPLRHQEVRGLRDDVIYYIENYLKEYMTLYVLSFGCNTIETVECKKLESRALALKEKGEKMENELDVMSEKYEKLAELFGVDASGSILK